MNDVVLSELRGGVLTITMNRPQQLNALSGDLVRGVAAAVRDARSDDVRVVVITGSGRAFCAGADLIEAGSIVQVAADFRSWLLLWRSAFDSFEELDKPVVAAINGITCAGGLELALACDVMVATRSAKIGDVHANYGLVPGGGGSQRLPDAVGSRWARWLMYSGELMTAEQALSIGLVQKVFEDATFTDDVWAMANKMANRSAPALALMKRLSRSTRVDDKGLALEIEAAAHLIVAEDSREGLAAFKEKRAPRFRGAPDAG